MANYVTQPRTIAASDGTDHRSGYNGTGTDIVKGYILKHDGSNVDGIALASASTDSLAGVSIETITNGMSQSYQRSGKAWVFAGDTVALGNKVVADATGRAVAAASASAANFENTLGTAVTAGAVGDMIEVELEIGNKAYVAPSSVATRAALKAIAAANRYEGLTTLVQSDNSLWTFEATNTGTTDTAEMLLIEPTAGTGAWVRADKAFIMKIPIAIANTDGQAIETIPAGFALRLIGMPYWEVTVGFTGGTSSAIGLSTNISGYETKGDLLGGASGELTAVLGTAGVKAGTIGDEMDTLADFQALMFVAASEIQFDRIASVYTAGSGFACIPVVQVAT